MNPLPMLDGAQLNLQQMLLRYTKVKLQNCKGYPIDNWQTFIRHTGIQIQGIQLFGVINLKQRSTQIEQIDFLIFILDFTTLRSYCSLFCSGLRCIFEAYAWKIFLNKREH